MAAEPTDWAAYARELAAGALELVFPRLLRCPVCDRPASGPDALCGGCGQTLAALLARCGPGAAVCPRCGKPGEAWYCAGCRERPPAFALARAAAPYSGPVQEAVLRLKFGRATWLADFLGPFLAGVVARGAFGPVDCLVPVPLHPARLRQRGFNQSLLLARSAGRWLGLPVAAGALRRVRATRSQVDLVAEERATNVRDAFAAAPGSVDGARVVLVDDVMTTGATLDAGARALLAAGAGQVYGLVVAGVEEYSA